MLRYLLIIVCSFGSLEFIRAHFGETIEELKCPYEKPPTLTYSSLDPRLGENLVLTCNIPAENHPDNIFWSKNLDFLEIPGKTLSFAPVLKADAGSYACQYFCYEEIVDPHFSQPSNAFILRGDTPTVSFAPAKPVIGENFTLTCNPPTYLTALKYVWLKKSVILDGQSGKSVTLSPVVEASKGRYYCYYYYSNNVTSELSEYYEMFVSRPVRPTLTVLSSAPYALMYGYLQLSCSDEDTAIDSYAFYNNGEQLENTSSTDFFRNISSKNFSGNFTCTCSNSYGESEHSNGVKITVVGPPIVTSTVNDHVIGGDINLICNTDLFAGNVIFTWYRYGEKYIRIFE